MDQESRNRLESIASADEPGDVGSVADALAETQRREQARAAGTLPDPLFKRLARRVLKLLRG
jgi:hypothetical protein